MSVRRRAAQRSSIAVKKLLPPLLLAGLIALGWQWYVEAYEIRPTTLPSPSRVLRQGWAFRALLWENTVPTLIEVGIGFSLSVAIATVFAVMMDFSKTIRSALYPLLTATRAIPIIAIAPLMIIWFGFGLTPKILVVIFVTFFPITVGWIDGFASTEREAMNLLASMGANRVKTFRLVRLPSALPFFFSGLRISIAFAVLAAVFAEYVGAKTGLGIFMLIQKNNARTDLVMATVVLIAILSVGLFSLVGVLQRLIIPWYAESRDAVGA